MNNDLKNLLTIIGNNDEQCIMQICVKKSPETVKSSDDFVYHIYFDQTKTTIDEIISNNHQVLKIIFKSDKSWLFHYTKRQFELLNSNNELSYFDMRELYGFFEMLFDFNK